MPAEYADDCGADIIELEFKPTDVIGLAEACAADHPARPPAKTATRRRLSDAREADSPTS